MSTAANNKLNAVYSALDAHDYNRAVKLTQHKSICNQKIALALRAHALDRLERKEECLVLLRDRLLSYLMVKPESSANNDSTEGSKRSEIDDCLARVLEEKETNKNNNNNKSNSSNNNDNSTSNNSNNQKRNPIETLDSALIEKDYDLIVKQQNSDTITDELLLATITVTLRSFRLHKTLVEMYTHAASYMQAQSPQIQAQQPKKIQELHKQIYFANLRLLMNPTYSLSPFSSQNILEQMQNSTMILARFDLRSFSLTSITALWRLSEIFEKQKNNDTSSDRMVMLLPRLAEGLAKRVIQSDRAVHIPTTDDWKVYLNTLEQQNKYEDAIQELLAHSIDSDDKTKNGSTRHEHSSSTSSSSYMSHKQKLELLVQLAFKAIEHKDSPEDKKQFAEMGLNWSKELYRSHTDDWSLGLNVISLSQELYGMTEKEKYEENTIIYFQHFQQRDIKKPQRGPFLLEIESIKRQLLSMKNDADVSHEMNKLKEKMIQYVIIFSGFASCCFTDLRPYLQLFLLHCDENLKIDLMDKCKEIRDCNRLSDHSENTTIEKKDMLGRYITACKLSLEIWALTMGNREIQTGNRISDLTHLLPDVNEMISQYELSILLYKEILSCNTDTGSQKEVLPGDDLIMLASQFLLLQHYPKKQGLIHAISLLEYGLANSPHNSQFILQLISLYSSPSEINASAAAMKLYQSLDIKQIQCDSLSYVIIPSLVNSGLYDEAVSIASQVIAVHRQSSQDVPEYTKKSIENGFYLIAQDMVLFQREKMLKSTQLLYAKGIVMDMAPLLNAQSSDLATESTSATSKRASGEKKNKNKDSIVVDTGCLGLMHGLVGGLQDDKRVLKIVDNSGDFFGGPSLLKIASEHLANTNSSNNDQYQDNRDFTVWNFLIGKTPKCASIHGQNWPTKQEIINESLTRGYIQGVLVRAVLVIKLVVGSSTTVSNKKKKKKRQTSQSSSSYIKSIQGMTEHLASFEQTLNNVDKTIMKDLNGSTNEGDNSTDHSNGQSEENLNNLKHGWSVMKALCDVIILICNSDSEGQSDQETNPLYLLLEDILSKVKELQTSFCSNYEKKPTDSGMSPSEKVADIAKHTHRVSRFFPSSLLPIFSLLQKVRSLLLFSISCPQVSNPILQEKEVIKKKLESIAAELKLFVEQDLIHPLVTLDENYESSASDPHPEPLNHIIEFFKTDNGKDMIGKVMDDIKTSHDTSRTNLLAFLKEIFNVLDENY